VLRVVDITEISAIVAAAGVLVGVAYYILDMRNQAKVRQTDMVMRLYAIFGSTEFQKAYHEIMTVEIKDYADASKKYRTNVEVLAAFYSVGVFFEGIGVLVKRELINIDLVDDLFSGPISDTWEKIKPIVEGRRIQRKSPQTLEWFEYLYNEMKKREQRQ
jgi:hypothetical protein